MDDTAPNLSLQSRNTASQDVSLLNLPNEMIIEICRSLCLHCRRGRIGELPHKDIAAGIQDQLAISRLTRCSKTLRDITQPILFHFFACLAKPASQKRLAAFIHTLFWRPDLASSVRSLTLWSPLDIHMTEPVTSSFALDDRDQTFKRAFKRLGGPQWEGRQYYELFELQELAIALVPHVGCVLLHYRSELAVSNPYAEVPQICTDWPQRLESLQHLILVDWRPDDCSSGELVALVKHMPTLESLSVVTADLIWEEDSNQLKELPALYLPRLKKLSLSGSYMHGQVVEIMIRHSAALEDLEYLHAVDKFSLVPPERFDLDTHLGTSKSTLKRLCYSVFSFSPDFVYKKLGRGPVIPILGREDEDYPNAFDPNQNSYLSIFTTGMSFHDFSVLETLELEQLALYGAVFKSPSPVEDNPDRSRELVSTSEFLAKFPASLKQLRLGFVFSWPIVFRDLMVLAEERARFPRLRSVTLDLNQRPPRKEYDILLQIYKTAGIALTMQYVVRHICGRGLLGAEPGYPDLKPTPISYE